MTHQAFAPHWYGPGRFAFGPAEDPEEFEGRRGRGRHRHRGRGFGPGPGFGPGGPGLGGPWGGPGRRRRGDVRLALLLLLNEEPRNGYQLMQEIEERSGGLWRPSPGSVYPTLSQLEDEGLIRATERDGSKLFELTETGRRQVADRGDAPAPWAQPEGSGEEGIQELRSLAKQLLLAVRQVVHAGDEGQIEKARQTLADARRALYRILADEADESPE